MRRLGGVLVLVVVVGCKKEAAPDAGPPPPPPRVVKTTTRWVADGTFTRFTDGGSSALVPAGTRVEVELLPDAGACVPYWVDGGERGCITLTELLDHLPTEDEAFEGAEAALVKGDRERAEQLANRATALSPQSHLAVFMLIALEEARAGAMSEGTKFKLKNLAGEHTGPIHRDLDDLDVADAGVIEANQGAWVAWRELAVLSAPKGKAVARLALNTPLDVLRVDGEWAEVQQHLEPVDAGADALDGGEPPDAGVPLRGFVPTRKIWREKVELPKLLELGSLTALALATKLAPNDEALVKRAIHAAFQARNYDLAVDLASQKPDLQYANRATVTMVFGCRGNKKKVTEVLSSNDLPAKVPPNACISDLEWTNCITCWTPTSGREEAQRHKHEDSRREGLRKRFGDGPFVRVELPSDGPQSLRGFVYELSYTFQQGRCDEYYLSTNPDDVTVSEPFKLPKESEDARSEWYQPKSDSALYGFVAAHSADDVRRYVASFGPKRELTDFSKLAPEPFVFQSVDTCGDCGSCGD